MPTRITTTPNITPNTTRKWATSNDNTLNNTLNTLDTLLTRGPSDPNLYGEAFTAYRTAWARANTGTGVCNVVFIGDSITDGYYAASNKNWFPIVRDGLYAAAGQPPSVGFVGTGQYGAYPPDTWTASGTVTNSSEWGPGRNCVNIGNACRPGGSCESMSGKGVRL